MRCRLNPQNIVCESHLPALLKWRGHLERYVDEQAFRFNNRKDLNDGQRFALAMSQVAGKRLTYSELTGKDQSPRHEAAGTGETEVPF